MEQVIHESLECNWVTHKNSYFGVHEWGLVIWLEDGFSWLINCIKNYFSITSNLRKNSESEQNLNLNYV